MYYCLPMDSENQHVLPKKLVTVRIVTEKCGCTARYIYPDCDKQDLVHGGCIESCACFKYKIITNKCDSHK